MPYPFIWYVTEKLRSCASRRIALWPEYDVNIGDIKSRSSLGWNHSLNFLQNSPKMLHSFGAGGWSVFGEPRDLGAFLEKHMILQFFSIPSPTMTG